MITESYVFWILKLDDIRELLFRTSVVVAMASAICLILFCYCRFSGELSKESADKYAPRWVAAAIIGAVLWFMLITSHYLVPSTSQMAMVKVIPAVVNSDFANKAIDDTNEIYTLGVKAVKARLSEYVKQ